MKSKIEDTDSNFYTPEFLLRRLLTHFSNLYGNGFEWKYVDGTTIRKLEGLKFENRIKKYIGHGNKN